MWSDARPPTKRDLRRDYGLDVDVVTPHEGGYESACWVADDTWFVKVWPSEPANLALLGRLHDLGLPVAVPLLTVDGALTSRSDERPYAVFPYVRGRTATDDDWAQTARCLRRVHQIVDVDLPRSTMDERCIEALRDRLAHPWIRDRGEIVSAHLDRLEAVIERARSTDVPHVLCHNDFGGFNLLLDGGRVAAILDWDHACLAPREHDVWIAAEGLHGRAFLAEYGATDLDLVHLEYALLARALRDMAARVCDEVDREGVDTWGFDRLARLDADLEMFGAFGASSSSG
jgi:aminoglycoside phosphotransferase (APT) family kinase protein